MRGRDAAALPRERNGHAVAARHARTRCTLA